MSVESAVHIDYPESDGRPMGETDLHRDWIIRIIQLLKHRFRGERVYVSGDLLVYYEEGNIHRFVVPDAFIVKQADPERRRTYKAWEEGKGPDVVFEVTSRSTWREDTMSKFDKYRRLGVPEMFLYDPSGDCLEPPLQGYHLIRDEYERMEPEMEGWLRSEELEARLIVERGDLIIYDVRDGQRWLTAAEFEEAGRRQAEAARLKEEVARRREEAARRQEEAARRQEEAARRAAEAKSAELEAELRRLREQLDRGESMSDR